MTHQDSATLFQACSHRCWPSLTRVFRRLGSGGCESGMRWSTYGVRGQASPFGRITPIPFSWPVRLRAVRTRKSSRLYGPYSLQT